MQDLFYLLLGVAVVVLPIYLIVKAVKNRGNKENTDLVKFAYHRDKCKKRGQRQN